MSLTKEQEQIIFDIDKKANKILTNGGNDEDLIMLAAKKMADIGQLLSADGDKLNMYCDKHQGFFRCMKMVERIAESIENGELSGLIK